MFLKLQPSSQKIIPFLQFLLLWILFLNRVASGDVNFTFNGFGRVRGLLPSLTLDGQADITSGRLLQLTNTQKQIKGHAFYEDPIQFKNSTTGAAFSFSTHFVFGIISQYPELSGNGITFVVAPSNNYTNATGSQYFGLLNSSINGNLDNHLFFVELDTIYNPEIYDIDDNHVGVDINSVRSTKSRHAGYYGADGEIRNLTLISGDPMQVWVEYDGGSMQLDVTLAPINMSKPRIPLLSSVVNLSGIVKDQMYVGFSSSTGSFLASHYILGWSFRMNGRAHPLDSRLLPSLPPKPTAGKGNNNLAIWVSVAAVLFVLAVVAGSVLLVVRMIRFSELVEDWEAECDTQRFTFKELYRATKGFREKGLLGVGGFGRVHRGVLPNSKMEVAVKRVYHDSKLGVKEFITEVASLGQLRHRNLVQLLGYCRRKGELLLVYDYMPNGSLDKLLFCNDGRPSLSWSQRLHIIKGVASGLCYLHEEWQKVVIHRDVKASNILLDGDMNGRLGDFGLARLYDHGANPRTTHVVGTMGYLAPELTRRGRATKATDVFAFGVFLLEVVCGRRPIEPEATGEKLVLVDWVLRNWRRGAMLVVVDPKIGSGYPVGEVETVIKLGLLCSHPLPASRPTIQQAVGFLDGDVPMPELPPAFLNNAKVLASVQRETVEDYMTSSSSPSITASVLWTGR